MYYVCLLLVISQTFSFKIDTDTRHVLNIHPKKIKSRIWKNTHFQFTYCLWCIQLRYARNHKSSPCGVCVTERLSWWGSNSSWSADNPDIISRSTELYFFRFCFSFRSAANIVHCCQYSIVPAGWKKASSNCVWQTTAASSLIARQKLRVYNMPSLTAHFMCFGKFEFFFLLSVSVKKKIKRNGSDSVEKEHI